MSRYAVTYLERTIIGEGGMAGMKAVVVRFSGCNLWDGAALHRDRGIGPCGHWCDAAFERGRTYDTDELVGAMGHAWPSTGARWCLLTGGEPTEQLDQDLVLALQEYGWKIAIETNGNVECPALAKCDYVIVSPKIAVDHRQPRTAHELRVTLPGAFPGEPGWSDDMLRALELDAIVRWPTIKLYVSPQDPLVSPSLVAETALLHTVELEEDAEVLLRTQIQRNISRCRAFVFDNPAWRLSLPSHKLSGYA